MRSSFIHCHCLCFEQFMIQLQWCVLSLILWPASLGRRLQHCAPFICLSFAFQFAWSWRVIESFNLVGWLPPLLWVTGRTICGLGVNKGKQKFRFLWLYSYTIFITWEVWMSQRPTDTWFRIAVVVILIGGEHFYYHLSTAVICVMPNTHRRRCVLGLRCCKIVQ